MHRCGYAVLLMVIVAWRRSACCKEGNDANEKTTNKNSNAISLGPRGLFVTHVIIS